MCRAYGLRADFSAGPALAGVLAVTVFVYAASWGLPVGYRASLLLMMLVPFTVRAQEPEGIVIDYNNPQKYVIAGITVDGNTTASRPKTGR